jgi:hypothetical protein
VLIILLVTGETICRSTKEHFINVARLAGNLLMLTFQCKRCKVVIELRRQPTFLSVTIRTAHAKTPFVRLIFLMAGITILRR